MGKAAKAAASAPTRKSGGTGFDWATFKGGAIVFTGGTLHIGPQRSGVKGSVFGAGGPYLSVYVASDATAEEVGIADLQAGYTFDKADLALAEIREYQGADGATKYRLKGKMGRVDFDLSGFPTAEMVATVKTVKVTAPPTR